MFVFFSKKYVKKQKFKKKIFFTYLVEKGTKKII